MIFIGIIIILLLLVISAQLANQKKATCNHGNSELIGDMRVCKNCGFSVDLMKNK